MPFKAEDMEGLMKTVLTGRYDPIPNVFSRDLSLFIGQMLQLKPKNRPSCDKMLKAGVVLRKVQELNLIDDQKPSPYQQALLSTIRMPKKLQYLTDRLPKSNYSLNLSYEAAKRTIDRPGKEER